MPDNGYWQLVTHEGDRHSVTVMFYDLASHLVYQEQIAAVPNWHNKKVCRVLAESLQTALMAYGEHHPLPEDSGFVSARVARRMH